MALLKREEFLLQACPEETNLQDAPNLNWPKVTFWCPFLDCSLGVLFCQTKCTSRVHKFEQHFSLTCTAPGKWKSSWLLTCVCLWHRSLTEHCASSRGSQSHLRDGNEADLVQAAHRHLWTGSCGIACAEKSHIRKLRSKENQKAP